MKAYLEFYCVFMLNNVKKFLEFFTFDLLGAITSIVDTAKTCFKFYHVFVLNHVKKLLIHLICLMQ